MSAFVLRVGRHGAWWYVVRLPDGAVVLRTQDARYARRHVRELNSAADPLGKA